VADFELVICDIDGCLSPEAATPMNVPGLVQVAEHNRQALAVGDRPPVTLCSGRPLPFVEALCRFLQNDRIPCVAENGTWLYYPGTNIYEMDPAITPDHLEIVHEASRWVMQRFGPEGVTLQPGKTAAVTLYHPDTDYLRSIFPAVREHLETSGWPFRTTMTWLYINCDLVHVSKATGIQRLLNSTRLEKRQMMAIGDTTSDLVMLDHVGYFACPANASSEVRKAAHYVAAAEEVEGVLEILRHVQG
jgi:hydroxymethylpyrimidine pyrophosphatase-like HAD family hydrolase